MNASGLWLILPYSIGREALEATAASDRSIAHPGQPLTAIASVSVRF
ncbi:hypothetical protein [Oceanibaculum sp.]|nr:hypothetical protein [Oceanibaculum sp.]MCH2394521.1 hypothetical protein [Oceanibaculum sp.]